MESPCSPLLTEERASTSFINEVADTLEDILREVVSKEENRIRRELFEDICPPPEEGNVVPELDLSFVESDGGIERITINFRGHQLTIEAPEDTRGREESQRCCRCGYDRNAIESRGTGLNCDLDPSDVRGGDVRDKEALDVLAEVTKDFILEPKPRSTSISLNVERVVVVWGG